jgi:hypothetical protein
MAECSKFNAVMEWPMETLGILDLLALYGFNREAAGKLVPHQHDMHPVQELL